MLNVKVVAKSVGSFTAISYVLCIAFGVLAPGWLHASWLLEALLPGFRWLSVGSFVLGLVEAMLFGAWVGALFSTLYNYFARRAVRHSDSATMRA